MFTILNDNEQKLISIRIYAILIAQLILQVKKHIQLMKLKGYNMEDVKKVMKIKEKKKGAFNNKIFLEYVDEEKRNLEEEKELNKDFRK